MAGLIRNLTETRWASMPGGIGWRTRPEHDEPWEQIGVAVCALQPGEALAMYHREDGQEDFLVLSGEGTLMSFDRQARIVGKWILGQRCDGCFADRDRWRIGAAN